MNDLNGVPVFVSDFLPFVKHIRRTWRERLFSRPWRPWQATRTETTDAIQLKGGIVMSRQAKAALERAARAEPPA